MSPGLVLGVALLGPPAPASNVSTDAAVAPTDDSEGRVLQTPPPEPEVSAVDDVQPTAPEPLVHEDAAPAQPEPFEPGPSIQRASQPPTTAPPPPDYDPDSGFAPGGGYWAPGDAPAVAPKDGRDQILAGLILLPLGTLATASAIPFLWATVPDHCPRRLQAWGINANADQCQGLYIYNWIRVSYGVAEIVTGAVMLAIGKKREREYEVWKQRRFQRATRPRLQLAPNRHGLAASVSLRF